MVKRQKPIVATETLPTDELDVATEVDVGAQDSFDAAYIEASATSDDTRRQLIKKLFRERLDDLLLRRGWSQAELGRRAGIARGVINAYCNEKALPTPLNLHRLARVFRVAPEDLIRSRAKPTDQPSIVFTPSPVDPALSYLKIEHHMPREQALRIINLITDLTDDDKPE